MWYLKFVLVFLGVFVDLGIWFLDSLVFFIVRYLFKEVFIYLIQEFKLDFIILEFGYGVGVRGLGKLNLLGQFLKQ